MTRLAQAAMAALAAHFALVQAPGCSGRDQSAKADRDLPAPAIGKASLDGPRSAVGHPVEPERDYPLRVHEPVFPGEYEYTGPTWNEMFDEPGESFEAYMSGYERATAVKSIRLWPLGKLGKRHASSIEVLAEFLRIAYDSSVEIMPARSAPTGAYNSHFRQYDANMVLNSMILDPDMERADHLNVAVTDEDMYADRLNYVFGYADYVSHVSMVSLSRISDTSDGGLYLRRLLKLVRHEIGHMYGMVHCTHPACVMRGVNSQAEADGTPLAFCPSCAAKLAWRIGDDGRERNAALAAFYIDRFGSFLERRLGVPISRSE